MSGLNFFLIAFVKFVFFSYDNWLIIGTISLNDNYVSLAGVVKLFDSEYSFP